MSARAPTSNPKPEYSPDGKSRRFDYGGGYAINEEIRNGKWVPTVMTAPAGRMDAAIFQAGA